MKLIDRLLTVGVLCVASFATAQTPSAPLPPAPATPTPSASRPAFALPPQQYERPTGPAPLRNANNYCFAPPEGIFTKDNNKFPLALRGPMRSYFQNVSSQIFSDWRQHMSLSEKNAWGKGRFTALRFAIRPDGSILPLEVTHSSSNDRYDAHAITAVNRGHFPPLPSGIDHPVPLCVVVGFHLDFANLPPEGFHDGQDDL